MLHVRKLETQAGGEGEEMSQNPTGEQFFEDDGVVSIWASDMLEVCIEIEPGADERKPYVALLTRHARALAGAILAMADALDAERPRPSTETLQ
jgi:hypothetical protein